MDTQDFHLGDDNPESVTPYDEATSKAIAKKDAAAERKRIERERRKAAPIIHETADWRLFLDPETLPQKAGCQPDDIGAVVLKELVDNALDAGASVTVRHASETRLWIVTDTGPGIDPDDVPRLFCVNRPLLSSKLKRMPTRGMLGNGLRVVMAWARKPSSYRAASRSGWRSIRQPDDHRYISHRCSNEQRADGGSARRRSRRCLLRKNNHPTGGTRV